MRCKSAGKFYYIYAKAKGRALKSYPLNEAKIDLTIYFMLIAGADSNLFIHNAPW